jgi:anti-sigma B factor antagonist
MWNPFGRRPEGEATTTQDLPRNGTPNRLPHTGSVRRMKKPGMIAEIEIIGQTAVATFTETELSQEEGAEQLADLLQVMAETGAIYFVLDVQSVQYMDTTCLGCLVEALNRLAAQGGKIALANSNQNVDYVFKLTRLDRVFRICPNVPAAMKAIEPQPSTE